MRFISAQFIAYLRGDLWKRNAQHANDMANIMAVKLAGVKGIRITQEVQSNGIFVIIPPAVAAEVQKHYFFYPWDEKTSEYRLMASWDTEESDIEGFITLLKRELEKYNS